MPKLQSTKSLLPPMRWPMFGNLSDTEVEIGMDEHGEPVRIQLFEHSIAAQPLTEPPTSKLRIESIDVSTILQSRELNVDTVNEDFEYEKLLIETEDGSPVTIGEFVAQAHEHLNQFKRIIIEFKCLTIHGTFDDEDLARIGVSKEDVKVYFSHIRSYDLIDGLEWSLSTFSPGEYGLTLEDIIRQQRKDILWEQKKHD